MSKGKLTYLGDDVSATFGADGLTLFRDYSNGTNVCIRLDGLVLRELIGFLAEHNALPEYVERKSAMPDRLARIRALAERYSGTEDDSEECSIATAAREVGVSEGDYDGKIHWPLIIARRSYRKACIVTDEFDRLESEERAKGGGEW